MEILSTSKTMEVEIKIKVEIEEEGLKTESLGDVRKGDVVTIPSCWRSSAAALLLFHAEIERRESCQTA